MSKTLKIRQIGNSLGVVLPKDTLERLCLKKGDDLALLETDGGLMLKAATVDFDDAMKWLDKGADKYRQTLRLL